MKKQILVVCAVLLSGTVAAELIPDGKLSDISNFRQYSAQFASSGQPTQEQLQLLSDNGFERIVYVAFTSSGKAYDDEDQLVKGLGMDYIQIPVDWENPTAGDFYAFAGVMQTGPPQKTLVHCQVNFRASAFSFLYRVIYEDVSVAQAKQDMNTVWQPDETWRDLIFQLLEGNGISPQCDDCDWSPMEH